jgi:hypothetical protein
MDFRALQHLPAPRVHWSGRVPRLPSFRLQGLATLLTASSSRSLVSPVSCSQRSWALPLRSVRLPQRDQRVAALMNPRAVCSPRFGDFSPGGEDRSFWVLPVRGRPWILTSAETPGFQVAPMGFPLPGYFHNRPWFPFGNSPLMHLAPGDLLVVAFARACASEYRSAGRWEPDSLKQLVMVPTLLGFVHPPAS